MAKMGISYSAVFFLLIYLVLGIRSYDVTNNDDIIQLNKRPYDDVTNGKTIKNPRIKEIWTFERDVTNDDDGKKDIEDGENVVKENSASETYFTKRKRNRNNIVEAKENHKKTRKWNNVLAVMNHNVEEKNHRADDYYGRKSNDVRTVIQHKAHTGWPKSPDVRTFTEGRSGHTGWPVVCVKKAVPICSDVKFRGRKVTYCLYKLQNVCNQWD